MASNEKNDAKDPVVASRPEIGDSKLKDLVKMHRKCKEEASEVSSTISQAVKDAQEEYGLEPKAFKIACQLDKITDNDPIKGRWVYHCLMRYIHALGLDEKGAMDFFLDKPKAKGASGKKKTAPPSLPQTGDEGAEVHDISEHRQAMA
jgi:hypothetical protein